MAKWDLYTKQMELRFAEYEQKYWRRSFVDHWEKNAVMYPEKEAFVDSRTRMTWAEVKKYMDRFALALLELGIKRDEVIATQLPNCVEYALIRGAHEKAGSVLLEMTATLRHEEVKYLLKKTGAVGIIIPWKYRNFDYFTMIEEIRTDLPQLKHILILDDEMPGGTISVREMLKKPLEEKYSPSYLDKTRHSMTEISVLEHTTGTTGLPKIVPTSTGIFEYQAFVHQSTYGEKLNSSDTCAVISPSITGPNILTFYSAPIVGARIVFLERFRPEDALSLIEKEKVTVTSVLPALLAMMIRLPSFDNYDLSSLRFIVCTGASLEKELAREAEEKIGCPIVQHYGSNEAGVVAAMQSPDWPRNIRLLTVGRPAPGTDLKIVDDDGNEVPRGEIGAVTARGPGCSFGYYKDKEATLNAWTVDGWYKMGDLGKIDEQGNLMIVGRSRDMIIRGGQNIFPIEIENMLLTHPSISRVAVVKMPDAIMGEKVCAYVILKSGQELSYDDMTSFLKEQKIASYKIPERLEIVDTFPLSQEQKVSKKDLEQDIIQKLKAEGTL